MSKIVVSSPEILLSMAKLKVNLSEGAFAHIHYSGFGKVDRDKAPHLHVRIKGRDASVRLIEPFEIVGDLPASVRKEIIAYIKSNLGYLHFAWDVLSSKLYFSVEWTGDSKKEKRNSFIGRFKKEFPDVKIPLEYYT